MGENENGLNGNGKKGVNLKNWPSICKSLEEGGLGIKNIRNLIWP